MNGHVAHRASLVFLRLVMERRDRRSTLVCRECVALEAHQVDVCALEQAGIGRAVGSVAAGTSFHLDGLMLVHERPRLIAMALETAGVLRHRSPELSVQKSSVRIVAIVALHQAFVHFVPKRPIELLLHFLVTSVAKLGRLLLHQELALFCVMR